MSHSISVLAACFAGLPEYSELTRLPRISGVALDIAFVDSRVAFMRRVSQLRPMVALLPLYDCSGLASAPLLARLRTEAPDVVPVVLARAGMSGNGIAEVVRTGAALFFWTSAERLVTDIHSLVGLAADQRSDSAAARSMMADLRPEHCVRVLIHCVENAHRHLSVEELAAGLGASRRSVSRWLRVGGWPSPAETIEWGRLLRASVLQWQESRSSVSLARASGFPTSQALQHATERLMGEHTYPSTALRPLSVMTKLRRRISKGVPYVPSV